VANRERGERLLVTDARTFTLRLEVWAICALEDRLSQTWSAIAGQLNAGRLEAIRSVVWAALQARHAKVVPTFDAAGLVIDAAGGVVRVRPILQDFLSINLDDAAPPGGRGGRRAPEQRPTWAQLYRDARAMGIAPETFWHLSLRELWLERGAARERRQQEHDRDLTLAWTVANLVWAKQMPTLDQLLHRRQELQPQSREEQLLVMQVLSNRLGIPLEKRQRES
jgi:hypothetical protein